MKIEALQSWHLESLAEQGVEGAEAAIQYCPRLVESGPCFAGYVDDGVVAAVGMMCLSPGVYRCWALTDAKLASKHFFGMNKAIKRFLDEHRYPRIETTVLRGNVAGHRWVTEILGFGLEGIMHNFYQGHDAGLYARIS